MEPKVSIITVVFNAAGLLESTILSIKNQLYKNIEYVIVDGGSTDGTIELIKKYDSSITRWISEADEGLYHAMNKGLELATGDYVWFINAGDQIYDTDVLRKIFSGNHPCCDIYYGETIIIDKAGKEIGMRRLRPPEQLTWKSLINGMVVCHQSIIVKKTIVPYFNTSYRIASDYNWVLKSLKKAETVFNARMILSRFLDGGINKTNILRSLSERFRIMIREFGFFPAILQHFLLAGRFILFLLKHRRF